MNKRCRFFVVLLCVFLLLSLGAGAAFAHFGMVIPSRSTVNSEEEKNINLKLAFWHPFENQGMNLAKPKSFTLFTGDKKIDLLPSLRQERENNFTVWLGKHSVQGPGLLSFVMEPQPYWEPEEDCYIVHLTKTLVAAFGEDEGWDQPLGLEAEIVPLSKPYALYTNNIFQGQVLVKGKPVPGALVEVEYYSGPGVKGKAPSPLMITQTVKADANGVFSYAAPKAGWWGFAALSESDQRLPHNGVDKPVELGAVLWVRFYDMK